MKIIVITSCTLFFFQFFNNLNQENNNHFFINYNDLTKGIESNNGSSVAFDNRGDIGYSSMGGGLSIGIKNGSSYTFTNYNSSNTQGIESDNGSWGIAFDNLGDIGYASDDEGLSIGIER